jgi:hypothetical protein
VEVVIIDQQRKMPSDKFLLSPASPGPERNQHRQVALSLRALFKNQKWLDAHSLNGSEQ